MGYLGIIFLIISFLIAVNNQGKSQLLVSLYFVIGGGYGCLLQKNRLCSGRIQHLEKESALVIAGCIVPQDGLPDRAMLL